MNFETCGTSVNEVWTKGLLLLLGLLVISCDGDIDSKNADEVNPYAGYESMQYDGPENWLCRPDIQGEDNACEGDTSSTIVFTDGTTQFEGSIPVEDQPVNCFYLYGTASLDNSENSDLIPGDGEKRSAFTRMARYRTVCNAFAPVYRSVTLITLFTGNYDGSGFRDKAYIDVVDAFKSFIANGDDRGFFLVSHSQGSDHLIRLIQEEIETNTYLANHMISAHLIGWPIELPLDGEVGATFASTPACTFKNEINCFVNYSSFKVSNPPTGSSDFLPVDFGATSNQHTRAACTNPVDLGGGLLTLDTYLPLEKFGPYSNPELNESIATPFVKVPDLFLGECIEQDGLGYLAITVNSDPADPRADDVDGSFPGWGLHRVDFELPHGDLARLAAKQSDKWLSQ